MFEKIMNWLKSKLESVEKPAQDFLIASPHKTDKKKKKKKNRRKS